MPFVSYPGVHGLLVLSPNDVLSFLMSQTRALRILAWATRCRLFRFTKRSVVFRLGLGTVSGTDGLLCQASRELRLPGWKSCMCVFVSTQTPTTATLFPYSFCPVHILLCHIFKSSKTGTDSFTKAGLLQPLLTINQPSNINVIQRAIS